MRVLHIITSLRTGGAEKLLLDSIPFYIEKGITIDLLLLDGEDSIFLKKLRMLNICNIYTFGTGSLYSPLFVLKIRQYLKAYDIIHGHLFPTLYWIALAKYSSNTSCKLVYTEHNTHNRRREHIWLRPLEKFMYKKFDKIICISDKTKKHLDEWLGNANNNTTVIHNGINLEQFKKAIALNRESFNIPLTAKIILMTARFSMQKDPNTLIRAFSKIENKNTFLILVGDGILRKESESLAKNLNVENRVLFLGIRDDIPQLIKMSDLCVLSSNWEGFGLVAVEYMAAGRPAIVSNVDGLREIAGLPEIIFKKGDDDDLKDKIEWLLNNKDEYNKTSEACYKRSLEFGIDKMVDSYINLYKEISK